jgi:hypothetical protein
VLDRREPSRAWRDGGSPDRRRRAVPAGSSWQGRAPGPERAEHRDQLRGDVPIRACGRSASRPHRPAQRRIAASSARDETVTSPAASTTTDGSAPAVQSERQQAVREPAMPLDLPVQSSRHPAARPDVLVQGVNCSVDTPRADAAGAAREERAASSPPSTEGATSAVISSGHATTIRRVGLQAPRPVTHTATLACSASGSADAGPASAAPPARFGVPGAGRGRPGRRGRGRAAPPPGRGLLGCTGALARGTPMADVSCRSPGSSSAWRTPRTAVPCASRRSPVRRASSAASA